MSLRINSGANFNNFQLKKSSNLLQKSLEKFATGKRINKAADDASGMVIADALASQAEGMRQAMRNANDAMNMVQIADGALQESTNLLHDIRNKALQAANASQTVETRQALQADISKSLSTIDHIASNTSYNGQALLSGQFTDKQFQVGANSGETIAISIDSAETTQLGNSEVGQLSDINVLSMEGAQDALAIVDTALAQINERRSSLGSQQNQLESTFSNLATTQVNLMASQSQINDLDFAEESITLNRMKILFQAQAFAQAQTGKVNQQAILGLLQG